VRNQSAKKEETTMTQVDQYREYVDSIRPPDPPRGSINEIQLLAPTARVWWMRSKHPLAAILADGYFDTLTDVRLQKEDTITLVASYGADRAEHAILIVDDSDKHGLASVSLLHKFERGK
jgi:hypothetical protein